MDVVKNQLKNNLLDLIVLIRKLSAPQKEVWSSILSWGFHKYYTFLNI